MATLLSIYDTLLSDAAQPLRNRVMAQCLNSANYILNESVDVPNHANRLKWAKDALYSVDGLKLASSKMYLGVCTNGTIQNAGNAATDYDIEYVVSALLDTVYAAG